MQINNKAVVDFVIKSLGGRRRAFAILEAEAARIREAWGRDTTMIGRILRAHLFVEHFLGEYISKKNPKLGSLDEARLSFAQKVALVGKSDAKVLYLIPGIRHLNAMRNRIAHQLQGEITTQDAQVFLRIGMFNAMRNALVAPAAPSTDPIDVLEDFSKHSAIMLEASSSEHAEMWAEAVRRGVSAVMPDGRASEGLQPPRRRRVEAKTRKQNPAARAERRR